MPVLKGDGGEYTLPLEELYLRDNDIGFIASYSFGTLKRLRTLDTSELHRLANVSRDAMKNLENLEVAVVLTV